MTDRHDQDTEGPTADSGPAVSTLRGAAGGVNTAMVGRTALVLVLLALATLVVTFFVGGINKNSQINQLRQHGVPLQVTVTGCIGQIGGSGSNPVGYSCKGTFSVNGRRHEAGIPGNNLYASGTKLQMVTVRGNPGVISTPSAVRSERASWRVFIVPVVLLVILVLALTAIGLRRRSARTHAVGGLGASSPA